MDIGDHKAGRLSRRCEDTSACMTLRMTLTSQHPATPTATKGNAGDAKRDREKAGRQEGRVPILSVRGGWVSAFKSEETLSNYYHPAQFSKS